MQFNPNVPHVTMDPRVHLPSTWRSNPTRPLTNRAINSYILEGRYGEVAKQALLAAKNINSPKNRNGELIPCETCKSKKHVKFLTYAYLPKSGYYCRLCVLAQRSERDKTKSLNKQWKERVRLEYV